MRKLFLPAFLFVVPLILNSRAFGQAVGDYGSNGTGGGNWSSGTTWVVCTTAGTWSGATAATSTPSKSDNVWIRTADVVTLDASGKNCKDLTIQSGATFQGNHSLPTSSIVYVRINGTTIQCDGNLGNGPTDNISLEFLNDVTLQGTGTVNIGRLRPNSGFAGPGSFTFAMNANINYAGSGGTGGSGIYSDNSGTGKTFTFNVNAGDTLNFAPNSNLTTGSSTSESGTATTVFNIDGVVNVGYGNVFLADTIGTCTVNINGTLNVGKTLTPQYGNSNVATITVGAVGTLNMLGTGTANFSCDTAVVTGAGSFRLSPGARISIGAAAGLDQTTGPIRTATRTFSNSGSYVFAGTTAQLTGTELPSTIGSLGVNNPAGLSLTNNLEVDSSLSMTKGTLSINGKALTYGTEAKLLYNGTAAQNTSEELLATLPNMEVDNDAGITLSASTTISGTLTFSSGKISTGANTLTAEASKITGAGPSSFVDGTLACPVAAVGTFGFPVGQGSDFLPDTLNFTALTGTGSVRVSVEDTSATPPVPAIDPTTKVLKRYVHIVKDAGITALSADVVLSYADADLAAAGGIDESTLNVIGTDGSTWSQVPVSVRVTADNTLQMSGLTSLSDYAISYPPAPKINVVSIAEARKDDNHDFVPDHKVIGDTLKIYAVVISPDVGSSSYSSYYVQDATGGIDVFVYGSKMQFEVGDSVFVIGTVYQNKGLTEIEPLKADSSNFGLVKHNAVVPKPKHLTLHEYLTNAETVEGSLVEVDSLYKASGTWGKGKNIYVTNVSGTDTTILYLNGNTNAGLSAEPAYPINLIGLASQYTSSVPANNGYEIIPRDSTDISKTRLISVVTIAEARKDDNHDFIPDHSLNGGDTLMVYGVVTSPNLSSSYSNYFIEDSTAGINVYRGGAIMPFNIGDSVFVIGRIMQYNGYTEISPLAADSAHFGLLKHDAAVPKPVRVSLHDYAANGEAYEGSLIEIDTLYKASGAWGVGQSVYLTDAGHADTLQMYLNSYTNTGSSVEPKYPINLVGIATQYSKSSPPNDGYEVVPRDSLDITHTSVPTTVTIAEARKDDDHDLVPDYLVTGDTLEVSGVVTTPNLLGTTGTAYCIQDPTGGIYVYKGGTAMDFSRGDSVLAIGTIAQYHGLTEFALVSADSLHFKLLRHDAALPDVKKLSLHEFVQNAETYESQLVEVDTLYKASGTWPAAGSYSSIYLTDPNKADTLQMYINKTTSVAGSPEPLYPINLVGVVSQYSPGSTVNSGYEIIPRDTNDVTYLEIVGVHEKTDGVPKDFYLTQNYPNPFNPSTKIEFGLPQETSVQITVFNVLGQSVEVLVDRVMKAGYHSVVFNGDRLPSGVYFYVMRAGEKVFKHKMMLVK